MKSEKFQTKRRPARKTPVHKFRANARRRKQRVAASATDAELDSHVPNLNIGRALVVITILHVVAIAGIIVHNKWFDGTHQPTASNDSGNGLVAPIDENQNSNQSSTQTAASTLQIDSPNVVPNAEKSAEDIEILPKFYLVETGDNYARIAADHGVDEADLRKVNKNVPMRAGRILRIPVPRLVAQETEEMRQLRANQRFQKLAPSETASTKQNATPPKPKPQAVLIKPKRKPFGVGVPRAEIVSEALVDSGKRYTVQAGDTVWRISQRFGVDQNELLQINNLSDPRKLSAGRELKIPR